MSSVSNAEKAALKVFAGKHLNELRERLISLLAKHTDKDLTRIEAVAIRSIFDLGKEEVEKLELPE